MDIYKYAEQFNADYLEIETNRIYRVQEYNQAIKNGLPTDGIKVIDATTKELIGIARKK